MPTIYGTNGDDNLSGEIVFVESEVFYGYLGNDTINGWGAADTIYGGGGDDEVKGYGDGAEIYLEDGNDILTLHETTGGADDYSGGAGIDTVIGSFIVDISNESVFRSFENVTGDDEANDLLTGNSGNNVIRGLSGVDTLVGGGGADTLDGGAGADSMQGGAGDDLYFIDSAADIVDEAAQGAGFDTVEAAFSVDLSIAASFKGAVEGLTLLGSQNLNGTGNGLGNRLTGNVGNNVLIGAAGDDTLVGGGGQDLLRGGSGNDTYVIDSTTDRVNESAAGSDGIDTIETSFTLSLASDTIILGSVENLTLTGAAAINGSGNSLANAIRGNAAVNILSGGAGDDTLDGGAGADSMRGGAGADTYFVDNSGDRIDEAAAGSGGIDTIVTARTYALDNPSSIVLGVVENLTLTGVADLNGAGSALANVLRGNAGANTLQGRDGADTLDGSSGADILIGGLGNDTFYVDVPEDAVIETANGGTDTIFSSSDYALSPTSRVEFLALLQSAGSGAVLTGNSLDQTITGNASINEMHGGGGADTLIGLGGSDLLYGGTGDDTYLVESNGDRVREAAGEGYDRVVASSSFTLAAGAEVEFLGTSNAAGSDPLQLVGNEFKQTIVGNAGANILNSRGGGDILQGRGGDDFYHVNAADKVQETANQGFDTVNAHESYVLAAGVHVERMQVNDPAGVFARNLTGNAFAQELVGGAGANVLNGLGGADTMTGGAGADTFVVDNVRDVVVESAADASRDTIRSSVTRVLDANVEDLVLVGAGAINGKGNALNNSVSGNAAGNVVTGMEGSDTLYGAGGDDTLGGGEGVDALYGGIGRDVLSGGAGADYFGFDTALNAATNVDRISDFSVADDAVALRASIFGYLGVFDGQLGLDAKHFRSGAAAADAGDRIIHNSVTGAILFDQDGIGGAGAVQFASVTAGLVLTNEDFLIF